MLLSNETSEAEYRELLKADRQEFKWRETTRPRLTKNKCKVGGKPRPSFDLGTIKVVVCEPMIEKVQFKKS